MTLTSLPSGVRSIGDAAFAFCTTMVLTSLPADLTTINRWGFQDCHNIALTSLPSGVTTIGSWAFGNCGNLALTSLPSGITGIGNGAFFNCPNIKITSIPSGITEIYRQTFMGCTGITEITLPVNLTQIYDSAFTNCSGLQRVSIGRTPPPTLGTDVFRGIPSTCTLCVMSSAAVSSYSSSSWGDYFAASRIQSCFVSIEEYIQNSTISIYPNPTSADFTVSFELEKPCNIQMILQDLTGREVLNIFDGFANAGTFTRGISTEHLSRGVYFLKIMINGHSTVEKIVVN
jgi:hypothetical protein